MAAEWSGEEDDEAGRGRPSGVCRHGTTGRVSAASPPNLQIDFGILELGSILSSIVPLDGIELVLVGLVGRTSRRSLSLNLTCSCSQFIAIFLCETPAPRVGQNSLLKIENHRYRTITDC